MKTYITIKSGAGGLDSGVSASMIANMYLLWAKRHGVECELMSDSGISRGEQRTIVIWLYGGRFYSRLISENGIHSLTRTTGRIPYVARCTSFVAVNVYKSARDYSERGFNLLDRVRQYTFVPYEMVKNFKNGVTSDDVDAVMNGFIDDLMVPANTKKADA